MQRQTSAKKSFSLSLGCLLVMAFAHQMQVDLLLGPHAQEGHCLLSLNAPLSASIFTSPATSQPLS